ncbi:ATP-binding protein [Streptomyces sp. GC420]|nr:ATP-binding protein [Streptomyces sp. GC420]
MNSSLFWRLSVTGYKPSSRAAGPVAMKIVVAGGFGVGKTTFVGSVSEITPLSTEALMTSASEGIDDLSLLPEKSDTTAALDFGRRTFPGAVLMIFGTPGQDRFWFMWDELTEGAIVAVVLADTRRLDDSFPALDYFERRGTPFLVAVNEFPDAHEYSPEEVHSALALPAHVPVMLCDARAPSSATAVLVRAMDLAIEHARTFQPSFQGALT